MPKRSTSELAVVFSETDAMTRGSLSRAPAPVILPVFEMDYLHFHRYAELGVCISGEGICRVEDLEYAFGPGDVQMIFPYQRHLSRNLGREHSTWFWVNIDIAKTICDAGLSSPDVVESRLSHEMGLCGIIDRERYPRLAELIRAVVREVTSPSEGLAHPDENFALLVDSLLLALCDASVGLPKLSLRGGRGSSDAAAALDVIRCSVSRGESPSIRSLAVLSGMSEPNFRRVFSRVTGLPPKDYIRSCFMRRAQLMLLSTDKKISEIAQYSGYEDVSGFNRCFSDFFGLSPSAFRKAYKP